MSQREESVMVQACRPKLDWCYKHDRVLVCAHHCDKHTDACCTEEDRKAFRKRVRLDY